MIIENQSFLEMIKMLIGRAHFANAACFCFDCYGSAGSLILLLVDDFASGTEVNKNGDVTAVKSAPKRKDKSSAGSKKRKGDDSDSSEFEDNDGEDSEDDEDLNGEAYEVKQKRGGRTSGRGRGGRGRGANKMATTAKSSGRGRGRPKKRGGSSR